jgi:hypothetical protein
MSDTKQWRRFYEVLPDGRYRITNAALIVFETNHNHRLIVAPLNGKEEKILLLDRPLKLGTPVFGSDITECFLQRIRVRDLPGWPPELPPGAEQPEIPALTECRLAAARLRRGKGVGQAGIEYEIDCQGTIYKAWQVGCPVPLLECLEATLQQEGTIGSRLGVLEETLLIGAL